LSSFFRLGLHFSALCKQFGLIYLAYPGTIFRSSLRIDFSLACEACFGAVLDAPFCTLPDEQASPNQIEILRAMSGEQRLRLAERLYWSAFKVKTAGLRVQHPDWSEERLQGRDVAHFPP